MLLIVFHTQVMQQQQIPQTVRMQLHIACAAMCSTCHAAQLVWLQPAWPVSILQTGMKLVGLSLVEGYKNPSDNDDVIVR